MKSRLTLKTRFTLVAAGAVAAVALAITAVAFLAIRTDLQNQVQQEVAARADSVEHQRQAVPRAHPGRLGPAALVRVRRLTYTQVITSAGAVWAPPDDAGPAHAERGGDRRGGGPARRVLRRTDGSAGPGRWCSPPSSPRASPSRWPSR